MSNQIISNRGAMCGSSSLGIQAPIQQKNRTIIELTPEQRTALEHLKAVSPTLNRPEEFIHRAIQLTASLRHHTENAYQITLPGGGNPTVFITNREFHIVQKAAGSGTYSRAFFSISIPWDGNNPSNRLVKLSRKSFTSEIVNLGSLSPNSQFSAKIDHFLWAYHLVEYINGRLETKEYLGVFNPSECDLCHIDYPRHPHNGRFVVKQLIDMADGIASFHRSNFVLRDIKGANLLCNWEGPGKVTDFGFVTRLGKEEEKHTVYLTRRYGAPYVWDSILGQKYRIIEGRRSCEGGYQGKAADIFALGRTLHFDVLRVMCRQYAKEKGVFEAIPILDQDLMPRIIYGPYSDEALLAFEARSPGRVFYIGKEDAQREGIFLFADREEVYQKTLEVLNMLECYMVNEELFAFRELAALAKELQNPSKQGLLDFLGVDSENASDRLIQAVKERLVNIKDGSSGSSSSSSSQAAATTSETLSDDVSPTPVYFPQEKKRKKAALAGEQEVKRSRVT